MTRIFDETDEEIDVRAARSDWLIVLAALKRHGFYLLRRAQRDSSFDDGGIEGEQLARVREISQGIGEVIAAPDEKVFR